MTKIDTKEIRKTLSHSKQLFKETLVSIGHNLCNAYDEAQKEIEMLKSTNEIIKIEDVCPACGSKEFKIVSHLDTTNKYICLTMICNLCTEELVMWDSLYEFKTRIKKELGE